MRRAFLQARVAIGTVLVALLCVLAAPRSASAETEPRRWLAEHIAFDASGLVAWRIGWADNYNPGFHVLSGGVEVNLGLEFDGGFGFVVGGRFMLGRTQGRDEDARTTYGEGLGHVAVQLRLTDLVRLGLGGSAGRLWQCCGDPETVETSAVLVGGFVRIGLDWSPITASALKGLSLWLRINVDGAPRLDSASLVPTTSMSLATSMGIRF